MGRQGSRLHVRGAETQAKGKDVGMALRLEKSQDPITGKARERAVHLPSPAACRTQVRPERGLPGHAGSGTLVIVEMKGIVWDSLPQRDKLHSARPGSRAAGGRGRDRMTSGCPSCQDNHRKEGSVSVLGTSVAMHCGGCDFPNLRQLSGPKPPTPTHLQALAVSLTVAQGRAKDPLGAEEERSPWL